MARTETACGVGADEEPLVLRQIGKRELVGIQKSSGDGATELFRVLGVGLLGHGQVASKRRLQRSQDVSAAATGTQKEDIHVTPACFRPALNRNGTTTHSACV